MKKMPCAGFSLLELMIAITVIGILASLAIPSYQDFAARAKIGEALNMASAAKLSVSEYYVSYGSLPENMEQAGVESITTQYIDAMDYTLDEGIGSITITLNGKVSVDATGKKISLQGNIEDNHLRWNCQAPEDDGLPAKLLPASCRPKP